MTSSIEIKKWKKKDSNNKEIAKQKSDLQQGSRVKYSAQFRSELSEAKSCEERGNWIEALEHKLYAEVLDKLLKMLDG